MSSMAEAHKRYYHVKDLIEDVIRSMDELRSSVDSIGLIQASDREAMRELATTLQARADHIVRVWD